MNFFYANVPWEKVFLHGKQQVRLKADNLSSEVFKETSCITKKRIRFEGISMPHFPLSFCLADGFHHSSGLWIFEVGGMDCPF